MESQELDKNPVVHSLRQWDRGAVAKVIEFRGETTVVVPRQHLLAACQFLATEPGLKFNFLSDIVSTDQFPLEPRFEVNYHLLALDRKDRIRIKVKINGSDPTVPSVVSLWPGANWHERENYDLFGIQFEGHPDLKRILMPDDWEGHPLRKDYPVEGYLR